ncbi:MAG: CPBP family intramembrane glutamic endopeptidase [Christensenellales bacterium]|jgi:membrane protease YdiL (CAAX protease family)
MQHHPPAPVSSSQDTRWPLHSVMLQEAEKARFKPKWGIQLLIFLALFAITQIAITIPAIGSVMLQLFLPLSQFKDLGMLINSITPEVVNALFTRVLLYTLFFTVITIVLVIVYCVDIEKRPLRSMGIVRGHIPRRYLSGYVVGVLLVACGQLLRILFGLDRFNGLNTNASAVLVVLFFLGFIIQAASEELLARGYFMVSLTNRMTIPSCVLISSAVFSLLHVLNVGVNILSLVNIFLLAVLFAVHVLLYDNLWGACAMHAGWNFAALNLFGAQEAGASSNITVFSISPVQGDPFGRMALIRELPVFLVLLIAIGVLLLIYLLRKAPSAAKALTADAQRNTSASEG